MNVLRKSKPMWGMVATTDKFVVSKMGRNLEKLGKTLSIKNVNSKAYEILY